MLQLSSPVADIPRIGPTKSKYLAKLNISHVRDFLYTFPRRYDDFSKITPIGQLKTGEKMTIHGRVKKVNAKWGWQGRRRVLRIFVDIEDDTGVINVTWYNLKFLPQQLWQGRELSIAGTVEDSPQYSKPNVKQQHLSTAKSKATQKDLKTEASAEVMPGGEASAEVMPGGEASAEVMPGGDAYSLKPSFRMRSPVIEFFNQGTHTGRITPVYPETYGVTSRFLRYQVKNALPLLRAIPEYLPEDIRQRNQLIGIHEAINETHFPTKTTKLNQSQRRLRFDELFFLQLAALVRRQQRQQEPTLAIKHSAKAMAAFIKKFPFQLTNAQATAIQEIVDNLSQPTPMNRLLQGDVGSGKSAVALTAAFNTINVGLKVFYLAPTEILARQQADLFKQYLGEEKVELLIGSSKLKDKKSIKQRMKENEPLCVVGTHALLQDDVSVKNLALAIVDEQHRFGVKQRQALQSRNQATAPHLLSMTATPIPRTLNLTVYGDLDISVLDEMPAGRKPTVTQIALPNQRDKAVTHILEQLHAGRQAYVISPLIELSEKLQVKSAKETLLEMHNYFPDIAIELVHGKMPSEEKKAVMNNFAAGAIQLLVSTSVVEVGVDVPNATCMIIEGAERFGLAQLHQFRGRIGRGEHQSYCYLFPSNKEGAASARIQIITQTNDGFKIAEEDLKLRGPGEVYGSSQSGFGSLQVASLLDYNMIKLTRSEAARLLKKDPELKKYPILRKKVEQKNLIAHFE